MQDCSSSPPPRLPLDADARVAMLLLATERGEMLMTFLPPLKFERDLEEEEETGEWVVGSERTVAILDASPSPEKFQKSEI